MLKHPVRREDEQASRARCDFETEIGETSGAPALDIVEIPEQHEITIRQMIDGIEMQLESLAGVRAITLQDEIGARGRGRHGNAEAQVRVVARQPFVDESAEIADESADRRGA